MDADTYDRLLRDTLPLVRRPLLGAS